MTKKELEALFTNTSETSNPEVDFFGETQFEQNSDLYYKVQESQNFC